MSLSAQQEAVKMNGGDINLLVIIIICLLCLLGVGNNRTEPSK
jgi:hypothetical protein